MKVTNPWALACIIGVALLTQSCKKDEVKSSSVSCYVLTAQETGSQGSSSETFTYNSSNVLTTVTLTFSGGSITENASYDAQGKLTKVTFQDGSYTAFTYDGNNLTQDVLIDATGTTISKDVYSYNSSGQLTQQQSYGLVNETPPLALFSHDMYSYSSGSTKNPSSIAHYLDYSGGGLNTTDYLEYDTHKVPTSNTYDPTVASNNVTKMTTKDASGTVVNTTTYTYQYNSNDYPTTATMKSTGNSNGLVAQNSTTTYTYNCK